MKYIIKPRAARKIYTFYGNVARLGSEEAIRQYIQGYIDQKVEELAN